MGTTPYWQDNATLTHTFQMGLQELGVPSLLNLKPHKWNTVLLWTYSPPIVSQNRELPEDRVHRREKRRRLCEPATTVGEDATAPCSTLLAHLDGKKACHGEQSQHGQMSRRHHSGTSSREEMPTKHNVDPRQDWQH